MSFLTSAAKFPSAFIALVICGLICQTSVVFANQLALRAAAKSGAVSIPIHELVSLNGITQKQLYQYRSEAVLRYPRLLGDTYEPDDMIFGNCESNKPWWGVIGMEAYGPGQHAIDGFSKESNYILNPFRLVSAEMSNQTPKKNGRIELMTIWKPNSLSAADARNPHFPWIWESSAVNYDPARASAEVTYDVTAYNRHLHTYYNKLRANRTISNFSLIAYNARDFGLRYMYMDPHKSSGVKPWPHASAVYLNQFLHCGGSCGYPGGCNNMSPYIQEMDANELLRLPARAYFKLWHDEPESVGDPPDFTFIINFK
jgi:hypothetical protein